MKILIIVVSFKRICKKTGDGRVCFLCDILHIWGLMRMLSVDCRPTGNHRAGVAEWNPVGVCVFLPEPKKDLESELL